MRFLILSDMHGNWEALQAVLRQVRRKRFDQTLVLGDLVGYGAAPNQVIDSMRRLPGRLTIVRGNHDKVVAGIEQGEGFNEIALISATWTRRVLTPNNASYLRQLPRGPLKVHDDAEASIAICHGSPADEDCYVFGEADARAGFLAGPEAWITFFGHTHLPSMFELHEGRIRAHLLQDEGHLELRRDTRYLINPGSIGQPRDRDPRASYMIYDSDREVVRWRRTSYPLTKAQDRIRSRGLPNPLADRLAYGV